MFGKKPKVVVVVARCKKTKAEFGIRFEQHENRWVADWSFLLRPGAATREGYGKTTLNGLFEFADSYPGCPGCENASIFLCSCGKIGCWNGQTRTVICPWCGQQVTLDRPIEGLSASIDR